MGKKELILKKINFFELIFILLLFSIFTFPGFKILELPFEIRFEDFLMILFLFLILLKNKYEFKGKFLLNYIFLIYFYIIWIFITITFNNLMLKINCYFEIYKIFKIFLLIFFIYNFIDIKRKEFLKVMYFLFTFNLLFNIFHYFNLFNFNINILPIYSKGPQYDEFIYYFYSISQRRILGIMGNPNNNGIIFSFFALYFFILFQDYNYLKKLNFIFFCFSFLLLILTGSRTTFISFLFSIIFYLIIAKRKIKLVFTYFLILTIMFLIINIFFNIKYIKSIWEMDLTKTNSFIVRINNWKMLINMVKNKLIYGNGPNKNFFYENNLHAENEYIFVFWKYGFIGLIIHLILLILPFFYSIKNKNFLFSKLSMTFLIIVFITSITNNPLSEPRILSIFSIIIGLMFKEIFSFQRFKKYEKINYNRI